MASGGDGSGPSRYGSGKGPMENLFEHVGEALTYDDVAFHQFLEERVRSKHPSPNPPITIPEFDPGHNTPYTNDPPPPSDDFFAGEGKGEGEGEEEKPMKSDLFKVHMKKTKLPDGTYNIQCNYCGKPYKTKKK